jgi:CRISPR/Cas system-associated exonuclease Cas4 (RecB family)
LSKPSEETKDIVIDKKFRGYNRNTFLTGEFARKISTRMELDKEKQLGKISNSSYEAEIISNKAIEPLSVSAIADKYCSTRRDLYFVKGLKRPKISVAKTWGRLAGPLVEKYVTDTMREKIDFKDFAGLIRRGRAINHAFSESEKRQIKKLGKTEGERNIKIGDTDWFLKLLDYNGRAELALKILNNHLKDETSLSLEDIKRKPIKPNISEIGINDPAIPDFIIPDACIVGDIKTGVSFAPHHQLTCAGYALAYENQNKKGEADINWGIIYFLPTRNPSAYAKPITLAQVYIFPIDDNLRRWFLSTRDEAYKIISNLDIPGFPDEADRTHCDSCSYLSFCLENGLGEG